MFRLLTFSLSISFFFFFFFLFSYITYADRVYIDPKLIAEVIRYEISFDKSSFNRGLALKDILSHRIWIVKTKKFDFIFGPKLYYDDNLIFPTVSLRRITNVDINCILRNLMRPEICFANDEPTYIRIPRRLRSYSEFFSSSQIKVLDGGTSGTSPISSLAPSSTIKILDGGASGAEKARKEFGLSGKKVVVGIVDTGIRWDSTLLAYPIRDDLSTFFEGGEEKGFSKATLIWDQDILSNFPEGFTYPDGFTYGFECKFPSLRSYLDGYTDCPSGDDDSGHGTHIAGVVSLEYGEHRGFAPDSPLVVVRTTLYEPDVVDAVRYIFSVAQSWGLPAVANISLGGHFGPHDGTSLFELLLTGQLGKGKILVAAAGNEAEEQIHVGGEFMGEMSFVVNVKSIEDTGCELQMWFPLNSGARIRVAFAGDEKEVGKGERAFFHSDDATKERFALIDFTGSADIPSEFIGYSFSDLKEGAIFLSYGLSGDATFYVSLPRKMRFDAWISSSPSNCIFKNTGDLKPIPDGTLAVPGTAPEIIAVGSYVVDGDRAGDISRFSSWGFEGSGKPNIVAPGEPIYSVCPRQDDILCRGSGTSQSTPHVGGAVALALERNPYLTPAEVIDALCKGAYRDVFTGETPNKIWGCGKLNIPSFLSLIPPSYLPRRDWAVSYSTYVKSMGGKQFEVLYISSEIPFRTLGSRFFDFGWSAYHILYFERLPDSVDLEFVDGNIRRVDIKGRGVLSCGCFITGGNIYNLFLIFLLLLIYVCFRFRFNLP